MLTERADRKEIPYEAATTGVERARRDLAPGRPGLPPGGRGSRDDYRCGGGAGDPTGLLASPGEVVVDRVDVAGLVSAAAAGDQAAWNALVQQFGGLVWHVARAHRLGDADAADVSQTVWLRLVESLPRLREPAALPGWIVTTARHESLRVLRLSGRELPADSTRREDSTAPVDASPEAVVELGEQRGLVRLALERLSLRCRSLLRALAYSPETSYAEISMALDMPIGSIGPTRSRCLQHLRRELVAGGTLATGD